MRVGTLLADDAGEAFWTTGGTPRNGRLALTKWLLAALAANSEVEELAVFGPDRGLPAAGMSGRDLSELPQWCGPGGLVWFEPLRHWWYRPALLRANLGGCYPVVTMVHSLGYPGQVGPTLASLACPRLACDVVVAPSRSAADVLARHCDQLIQAMGLSARPPEIRVIPYGCPKPGPLPKQVARRALGFGDAPVVLFLGRLSADDKADFDGLLSAATIVRREWGSISMVLAGHAIDPAQLDTLRLKVAQAGLEGSVELRPGLSEVEKELHYSAADIFVSPSNATSESFGLSIVEAMLHGLPVVCSAWSGYRELVRDGVEGLLVPTRWDTERAAELELPFVLGIGEQLPNVARVDSDALARALLALLSSGDLRQRLGDAAKTRAEQNFTIEHTAAGLLDLFRELLRRANGGSVADEVSPPMFAEFARYATPQVSSIDDPADP
jgi:glycosyltransferase involved in cell wall biosynthesis